MRKYRKFSAKFKGEQVPALLAGSKTIAEFAVSMISNRRSCLTGKPNFWLKRKVSFKAWTNAATNRYASLSWDDWSDR